MVTPVSGDCTVLGVVTAAGPDCTIVVQFAPNAAGPFSGSLVVTTDGGTVSAPLSGTGLVPAATVTPASPFDFGNVNVTAPAASQIFKVTNSGDLGSSLQITNVQITGSTTFGETHETLPGAITTTVGDSFDITVTFDPTVAGERTATLVITTNVGTQLVSLSGTGTVTPDQPQASADETALDFGNQDIDDGATSAQTVTVTNVGDPGSILDITNVADHADRRPSARVIRPWSGRPVTTDVGLVRDRCHLRSVHGRAEERHARDHHRATAPSWSPSKVSERRPRPDAARRSGRRLTSRARTSLPARPQPRPSPSSNVGDRRIPPSSSTASP